MPAIVKRIRDETAEWHSRIETLVPVFDAGFTISDYRRLLERFYGFYRTFEPTVGRIAGLPRILPDWMERQKSPWLEADLLYLGSRPADLPGLPVCSRLPRLNDLSSAMGALYVIEGSTLGGQIICRHLAESLGVLPEKGAAFFAGHGNATGTKWKTFTRALAGMTTAHNEDVIVQSAKDTFEALWLWLFEDVAPCSGRNQTGSIAEKSAGY
jgi:heme oxygenase